jgi:DNA polymerase elongation subunit (family B)
MQYNISPETMLDETMNITVNDLLDKKIDLNFLSSSKKTIAANGSMYRTDIKGILPQIIEKEYNDRVTYKRKMLEAQQRYENTKDKKYEKLARRYHLIQHSKKIALNSAYGAIGNRYFRYFNHKQAEAITTGGQLAIRWIEEKVNQFFNKMLKNKNDYVIASDTDSIYVNFSDVVKKLPQDVTKEKIIKILDKFCSEKLEPYMNVSYQELADYTNAYAQKMVMKREVIADKGIWTAKKRYILNVYNSEGVQYAEPKLKIMGIEAVKSSTPQVCRSKIREALNIIMTKDEKTLMDFVKQFRMEFDLMSPEQISFPRSANNIKKYSDSNGIYKKSTPMHVKGALIYNYLIKKKKIANRFPEVQEGDKIKYCHIRAPNLYQTKVISFPVKLPKAFGFHSMIDFETQFKKSFMDPLRFILAAIKWNLDSNLNNSLDEFF